MHTHTHTEQWFLPARGKSYISKAIVNYLTFLGCPVRLFNAGNKRRERGLAGSDASFFDANNKEAKARREQLAMETLDDLLAWLESAPPGCACGIFDATNTTVARRRAVIERCARADRTSASPLRLVFVESVCNDDAILRHSYQMKLSNEDYQGSDPEKALADFISRIREYEKVYETITDDEARGFESDFDTNGGRLRYVQTIDAGRKLVASGCTSMVMSHVVMLLHSIHLFPRKISIVLAGESQNDSAGIRGGDTALSALGLQYAEAVCELVCSRGRVAAGPVQVLMGTHKRYRQMTDMLCKHNAGARDGPRIEGGEDLREWECTTPLQLRELNELCFGSLEGIPGGKLRHSFPDEFAARELDRLNYRYPGVGGESYTDKVMALRSLILWLERTQSDTVVVCDVAVARVLLGYYECSPLEKIPDITVSPGVIELTRSHSGFSRSQHYVSMGKVSLLA
jgi:6-phosphofructo-2-kinase